MNSHRASFLIIVMIFSFQYLFAQREGKDRILSGVVYDSDFRPVPYTHVIAQGSKQGDMTDSMGIFKIRILPADRLRFYNIAFKDTSVFVSLDMGSVYIKMERKAYPIPEARIYDWGNSYDDFLTEVKRRGVPVKPGEKMGLPTQDPDAVEFSKDEKKISNPMFLLVSPVSALYYNYSKREINARKAYKLQKDQPLIERFEETLSKENLGYITKLNGKDLEAFIVFLNENLKCTYHCSELQLITEIFSIWEQYQKVMESKE